MKIPKFQKGAATYICAMCGKRTRAIDTMTAYEVFELCKICYDALEAENQASDQASSTESDTRRTL